MLFMSKTISMTKYYCDAENNLESNPSMSKEYVIFIPSPFYEFKEISSKVPHWIKPIQNK